MVHSEKLNEKKMYIQVGISRPVLDLVYIKCLCDYLLINDYGLEQQS